jgi:hypothetical protein
MDPTSRGLKLGGGDGRERLGSMAAREEEERANRRGPHGSDTRESVTGGMQKPKKKA